MDHSLVTIEPTKKIADAIRMLNISGSRCLVVVSANNELLGVLSDGDLRRAIFSQTSLNSSIEGCYNDNPYFIYQSDFNSQDLKNTFLDKKFDLIPIVDQQKVLQSIHLFDEIFHGLDQPIAKIQHNVEVVIMAGGLGKRLMPITKSIPKPMVEINGKPIIQMIVEKFFKFGIRNFTISVNHLSEQIISFLGDGSKFNVEINYIHENEPLGTCGSLSLIENIKQSSCYIVTNSDVIADIEVNDLLDFHQSNSADISICTKLHEVNIPYGVIQGKTIVEGIEEKPNKSFWINSGVYVLSPNILSNIKYNTKIDMPNFINEQIEQQKKVMIYPMTGYWKDIGHPKELEEVRNKYKDNI
ncbi:nucleotidyltransferase family protein [Gammaproteobacteria bacterium]|jgi:dTDP-glucose pyrophosphorylase|nr:nucleotidyltransferase family protein [Gammaproteobacteria bacterium]